MDRISMDRIPDDLMDDLKETIRTEYGADWRKEWSDMRRVDQIEAAEEYLNNVKQRTLASWMERKKVVWVPTMLGIGLAIAIVWGVR